MTRSNPVASSEIADSKERFTSRVDDYRKFRPHYPATLWTLLQRQCGLKSTSVIADIGAGTGNLAEVFLQQGNPVIAVEPNAAMRAACEELRSAYPKLECVEGAAEATGLPSRSVDFVTVGQAMHWFDRMRARQEFVRILRPESYAVIVTNERRMGPGPFLVGYEQMIAEYGIDYPRVKATYLRAGEVRELFAPATTHTESFPNHQDFDFVGLLGRTSSSSYMPGPEHARYERMRAALMQLFERHQTRGRVRMMYNCHVNYARLT